MKSKYASISLNTEVSPYCAKVDWHIEEPTYFQILESKNVSEIEKLFEDWISTRVSHRHSFKIESFDIDNISFLPFVIPQNHGKIKMDNDDKITQIVQEWLEKDIFASKNILNTVSLSQFDILLQQKFSTPEYYAMHQTDSGVAELHNLPLDWVERGYHQFGGWIGATQRIWVEVDLIGHSFHGAKPYEPSEEAQKFGINEVFVVKSQIEKNSNHARLYEKVGNRCEYVLAYQKD